MTLRGLLLPLLWLAGASSAREAGDAAADALRLPRAEAAVASTTPQPADAAARFALGVLLLDQQQDARALDVFERLTQDFPELPEPLNNIALLHARAGRLEAARLALEAALRNDPSHARARRNLGEVHLMLARQAFELAATALPTDTVLQARLQAVRELLSAGR